jgi:hypothetical protein
MSVGVAIDAIAQEMNTETAHRVSALANHVLEKNTDYRLELTIPGMASCPRSKLADFAIWMTGTTTTRLAGTAFKPRA